jgi:AsmA-like C-terminal region
VSSGDSGNGRGTRIHLNLDPGTRALAADLDGVLRFEARVPRFEGAVTLAEPPMAAAGDGNPQSRTPWRISAKVKADPAGADLQQVEASVGPDDRALKFLGVAEIRFGASPLLQATLSARQLDADKFVAKDNDKAAEPIRLLPGLRALSAAIPVIPIPAKIDLSAEQIMLGGRPLQNLAAGLLADEKSWTVDRLDFRAPGATEVAFSRTDAQAGPADSFNGMLDVASSDPDTLVAWLQGRSDIAFRNQKPLHLRGNVSVAADHLAIEAMKAEIDGGAVEGRAAFAKQSPGGSRFNAELKADRLDLDAAAAFARSLAGPPDEWPDQALLSLDIGRAIAAGQEWGPLAAKFSYDPKTLLLDRLKLGQPENVVLEGRGSFDRGSSIGTLGFSSTAASLARLTALVAPFAPTMASRLNALGTAPGPVRLKLALDLNKSKAQAGTAVLDLDAPQLAGSITMTARTDVAALRGMDVAGLQRSEVGLESKLSSPRGGSLLALLGLDRAIAAGDGPLQFQGSVTGAWGAPLRLKVKLSGNGLDADAEGTAEPWAQDPKAGVNLMVRHANLAPLFDLKPSDTLMQDVSLSSRVSLANSKWSFDDLDGLLKGSRLRGHLALSVGNEKNVDGEIGLDALDLAPAFALAIGSAGRNAEEPLGSGLLKGWRGRIAFQALRGLLPGGGELRPVSGALKSDGQSLSFDAIKGTIGGGEATASIDTKAVDNGMALNARVQFSGVDGAALRYRGLAMPAGRTSLQMTLATQGRSTSALMGALSGNGTVTLESASIAGLDPRAFEAAIHASDSGQATDDVRLRQAVDPALSVGSLSVPSAQIPFTVRDGRLRVGATALDASGARVILSGGYDIPADQADIRAVLTSTAAGAGASRPEIQLFAVGSPDKLDRTLDVSALSSWLAVRAIDRETRRLDSIERGELPHPSPVSIPPAPMPPAATTPAPVAPAAVAPPPARPVVAAPQDQPLADVPLPGRDPRRLQLRPRVSAPRPAPVPSNPGAALAGQQVVPLPPPIEIRPAPGAARQPRLRPPMALTPPVANAPRSAF